MEPLKPGFSDRTNFCVGIIILVALCAGALMTLGTVFR